MGHPSHHPFTLGRDLHFLFLFSIIVFVATFQFKRVDAAASPSADLIVCGDVCHPGDSPGDIAIDPTNGDLYVSDMYNHRVLRFGPVATLTTDNPHIAAVFGQADLVGTQPNQGGATGASSMKQPTGIFVDKSGTLWVADSGNNRVLWFDNARQLSTGDPATGELGQIGFSESDAGTSGMAFDYPTGVHVDDDGNLWVVDRNNNRVLRFDDSASLGSGQSADGVLGQPDVYMSSMGIQANQLTTPTRVTSCLGTVVVSDSVNARILLYPMDEAAKEFGAMATYVLMQTSFANAGPTTPTASTGGYPSGLACDPVLGDLYVADQDYSRVLVYQKGMSPEASGIPANIVVGQSGSFSSMGTGTGRGELDHPGSVFFHQATRTVWVADTNNNRVLRFSNIVLQSQTNTTALLMSFIADSPNARLLPLDSAGVSYPGEFELQLHPAQLIETSSDNQTVVSETLPETGYNVSTSTDVEGTQYFKFSSPLTHAQGIEFDFAVFRTNQTLNSAGVDFSIRPSTVKLSLSLDRWNFTSTDNQLSLVLSLQSTPPITSISQVQGNDSQVSTFLLTAATNLTITIELLNVAEIDGVNTRITYWFNGSSQLILTFPSFTKSLVYDPNFSVAFGEYSGDGDESGDDGESDSLRWLALIALIVVPGAFLLVALSGIVIFWLMHKRRVNGLNKVNFGSELEDDGHSSL